MKILKTLIVLICATQLLNAQVKGNKNIVTKMFETKDLRVVKINLYAKIIIDQSLEEGMQITMDSNLFDKIDTETVDGTLHLDQLEWVQPSREVLITIGAPNLKRIEKGTHKTLEVVNVSTDQLNVMAFVGKVNLQGTANQLNLGIENGTVDASNLKAKNVRANIWGWGKATVFAENEIYSIVKNDGKLALVNTPKSLKGDTKKVLARQSKVVEQPINWISFKIKNNSWNRNQFYVVGPKADGSKFSYGFPMMPGKVKKERWSVGTKIYKVNKIGFRKLLVTITSEDQGKTVKLFSKG